MGCVLCSSASDFTVALRWRIACVVLCRVLIDNETEKNATLVKVYSQRACPSLLVVLRRDERCSLSCIGHLAQLRVTNGYLSERFMVEFLVFLGESLLFALLGRCNACYSSHSALAGVRRFRVDESECSYSVRIFNWGSALFSLSRQASLSPSSVEMQLISNIGFKTNVL